MKTKITEAEIDGIRGHRLFIEVNNQWFPLGDIVTYAECLDLEQSLLHQVEQPQLQAA